MYDCNLSDFTVLVKDLNGLSFSPFISSIENTFAFFDNKLNGFAKNSSKFSKIHLDSMDADSDLNYGVGYRKMKLQFKKMGWKSLLQSLRKNS